MCIVDSFDYPWPPPTPPPLPATAPGFWCREYPDNTSTQALSDQMHLAATIESLLNQVQNGKQLSQKDLEHSLLKIQVHASGLGEWFSRVMCSTPYNEQRMDTSAAAQKVFDIPELFEMITEYLSIHDIVRCTEVSRTFKASIDHSAKIQDQICHRASPPESHLKTPLNACFLTSMQLPFRPHQYYDHNMDYPAFSIQTIGFSCRKTGFRYHGFNPVEVDRKAMGIEASFSMSTGQRLPRLGSQYRQMYICQPPLQEMDVSLTCCYPSSPRSF